MFQTPELKVIAFEVADIITASGDTEVTTPKDEFPD